MHPLPSTFIATSTNHITKQLTGRSNQGSGDTQIPKLSGQHKTVSEVHCGVALDIYLHFIKGHTS